MKNNMLRGPHGRLMRVDVVELQSALLKCKGLAKKGGKKINKVGMDIQNVPLSFLHFCAFSFH